VNGSTQTAAIGLADPAAVQAGTYAWNGPAPGGNLTWFLDGIRGALGAGGYRELDEPGPDVQVVVHHVDPARPRPYRRQSAPTFVIALTELPEPPADLLRTGYPLLVRGLANLSIMVSESGGVRQAHFVTLEQGTYTITADAGDAAFFAAVYERLEPLASSRLVIANEFVADLPSDLWDGDEYTTQIGKAGKHLDALDLLPAAFPIEEILSPRDMRHVKLLYGIGGLSYGNASARRIGAEPGPLGHEFWMSASGVDKANLERVGKHILLVRGYDPTRNTMVLSVPPDMKPNRVSVDAIEHWMIYDEHPQVGAILHVHAWMDGTSATEINYPCGTLELARSVADLVRVAPDPAHAVVGQRNHGLTITGESLDEILDRVEGRLVRNVPMD
jgi:ribulose-5-phosphate 4-epimerase/fuculose-1-phosphate aldolase